MRGIQILRLIISVLTWTRCNLLGALRDRSYKTKVFSYKVRYMVTWQDRTGRWAEDVELNAVERAPNHRRSPSTIDFDRQVASAVPDDVLAM